MKTNIPVLEGYAEDGRPVFGRMPLESPEKPAGEFSEGESYPTSGDGTKRISEPAKAILRDNHIKGWTGVRKDGSKWKVMLEGEGIKL